MITVFQGSPVTVSVPAGSQLSTSTTGYLLIESVSGLGLGASTIASGVYGSNTYGPWASAGVVKITATVRNGGFEVGPSTENASLSKKNGAVTSVVDTAGNPAGGVSPAAVGLAGDSIAQESIYVASGAIRKRARSALVHALSLAGQPFDLQVQDNYAVPNQTSADLVNGQLPLILAAIKAGRRYARMYLSIGTNDQTLGGLTASQTLANLTTFCTAMRSAGVKVDFRGVCPRGAGALTIPADVSFTATKQHAAEVNWGAALMHQSGLLNFFDATEVSADNSTAFGNMLAAHSVDGLHPNNVAGFLEGQLLAASWLRDGVRPSMKLATIQGDVFSRTGNRGGVLGGAGVNPLLQGGTGAPTGSGWAVAGGTWSKTSRTLANGQTRSDPTCALAASANHTLTFDWTGSGAWSATQLQPGDYIEARALVKLNSAAGITQLRLQMSENDGTGNIDHGDIYKDAADSGVLPYVGNEYVWLRAPAAPVRAYSGSSNVSTRIQVLAGTAGAGAGSIQVMSMEARPYSLVS